MNIFEDVVRLVLLLLCLYGYTGFLKRKWHIEEEFAPIVVFCGIGNLIFLSGILNIMDMAFWIIFLCGFILALYYFIKDKIPHFSFGTVAMLVLICYLFFFLSDIKYYHYDNFSHWGLVIKTMFKNSSFPNFQDGIIQYQSYPLGSASFIWFICKIIGYTEGHALFAQSVLYVGCAGCLYAFPKKGMDRFNRYVGYVLMFLLNLVLISYGHTMVNGLFELLVDVLLGVVALAALAMVIYYNKDVLKAALCVSPLLIFEICIKNSGIMWVFAITIAMFIFSQTHVKIKEWVKIGCLTICLPMLFRILWNKHTELVFAEGNVSTHSMSVENYSKIFAGKTKEDIYAISKLFFEAVFSWNNRIWIIVIVFGLLVVALFFFRRKLLKKTRGFAFLAYFVLIYVIYQIGNYAMYLFSMPLQEALYLAGYGRYAITVEVFLWGLLMIYIHLGLKETGEEGFAIRKTVVYTGLFLGLLLYEAGDLTTLVKFQLPVNVRETSRIHLDNIVEAYHLKEGKKSLIYIGGPPDRDAGYRYWMSRYVLYSANVKTITSNEVYELNKLNQWDYVIILEPDEVYENWLSDANLPIEFQECFVREDYNYIKLTEYVPRMKNEQYLVFISVKDDASVSYNNEMKESMHAIGLKCDLTNQYRSSYVAIIDGGNVVFEEISKEKIIYEESYGDVQVRISSAGIDKGNRSEIVIDGIDYSLNKRGINIVIYDKENKAVCDQITFDTWLMDGAFVN